MNRLQIAGLKIGMLTAVEDVGRSPDKKRLWRCVCECGGEVVNTAKALTRWAKAGANKSCGCVDPKKVPGTNWIDISGEKVGRWTVLEPAGTNVRGLVYWMCRCECGTVARVNGTNLRNKSSQSCGCRPKDINSERTLVRMEGRRYGSLVVMDRAGSDKFNHATWNCRCDCGNVAVVSGPKLRKGNNTTCGCSRKRGMRRLSDAYMAVRLSAAKQRKQRERAAGGRYTQGDIRRLYTLQKTRCAGCGDKLNGRFHKDHKVPIRLGGGSHWTNIQLLCAPCNLRKGGKDLFRWANENGRLL